MIQIAVVGGGPGGIAFAQTLSKLLTSKKDSSIKITVFEKRDFFFHAPGALRAMVDTTFAPKVLIPYDNVFKGYSNAEMKFASVDDIDYETKTIVFSPSKHTKGNGDGQKSISYHFLILATGSSNSSPSKPTAAVTTHEEMIQTFTETATKIKSSRRILIIGGGAVGIEMAGELKSTYPNKHIMLIDSNNELLTNQNVPKMRGPVKKMLTSKGVELFLGQKLKEISTTHQFETKELVTNTGIKITSDARLWCIGMKPNIDLMKDSDCIENGRYIKVNDNLEVDSPLEIYKNVFVVGDANNHPTPKLAYWAMEQGKHLARGIAEKIDEESTELKPYLEPSTEALILPFGPDGGLTQLPMCGGMIVGNLMTRMIKSKDLMTGMFWGMLNSKIPN